jgi:hypothetical protein
MPHFIGIVLLSVSGSVHHTPGGGGLIDDTGLAASAQSSIEIMPTRNKEFSPQKSALSTEMQKILHVPLELLQVAGGDVNISKCACFRFFHRWYDGRATLLKIQDSNPLITITHPHNGEIKTINKKDPTQARRALGWMMTTDRKSTAGFKVLKQKSKLFTGAILQSRIQRYDTTTAYK